MDLERVSLGVGHLWGRTVVAIGAACFRRRARQFDIAVWGDEHLAALAGRPFVLVSNHTWPTDSPLGALAGVPFVRQYRHSADSFILDRVVRERAGRPLHTAARCDGARWARRPWKRWIQERIGQPFARGQIEALPGYVVVERNPGCSQRPFLEAAGAVVGRGGAILIFPGGITLDRADTDAHPQAGAAHLALRFGLPVLPVCLLGTESWRAGRPVTVAFGPAFAPDGLTKGAINAEIIRRVQALHAVHAPRHRERTRNFIGQTPDSREAGHVAAI